MGMQEISKAYRQRAGLDQIEDEPEVVEPEVVEPEVVEPEVVEPEVEVVEPEVEPEVEAEVEAED